MHLGKFDNSFKEILKWIVPAITLSALLSIRSSSQIFVFVPIVNTRSLILEFVVLIDKTSLVFLLTVSLISLSVFTFRSSYIKREKFFLRFSLLLISFVFSIVALILCPNLFSILLGWDGLGISSYLLVIYYNRDKSYNAGIVTALTNRLGDVIIILAIAIVISQGSWVSLVNENLISYSSLFQLVLIIGCFTKRAQIPFRAWLPAAIAAPTPVSSLVHSSTLVTAGVYVLIRHVEHIDSFLISDYVFIRGIATITIASLSAVAERDIKKIVALSTLSQLGIIVIRIGIRWILIAFMHLIIHAFFKAIIFISTGNAIHVRNSYQSCRKTGSIIISTPLNSASLVTGAISLIGAPFAAAFFSKEPILEGIISLSSCSLLDYYLIIVGVLLTMLYRTRFLISVVSYLRKVEIASVISEEDTLINLSVVILFVPSFTRGAIIANSYSVFINKVILYPSIWKISVFVMLLFGVLIALKLSEFSIVGGYHWLRFNIWLLPSFSSSFSNHISFIIGKLLHINNFYWNLSSLDLSIKYFRTRPIWILAESIFVFRLIIFIPIVMLLLINLYL